MQEIFGLSVLEKFGVLLQFVGDLVNDESSAGCERIVGLLKKRALLVDLKDAEGNPGHDVVAGFNSAAIKFALQVRRVVIDHVDPGVVTELAT